MLWFKNSKSSNSNKNLEQEKEETPAVVTTFFNDFYERHPFSKQELLDIQEKVKTDAVQEGSSNITLHSPR